MLLNVKTSLCLRQPLTHEILGATCAEGALGKGLAGNGNACERRGTGEVAGAAPTPPSQQREELLQPAFAALSDHSRFLVRAFNLFTE